MPPTLPNTLTNGTTADASQVMANLNAINAAVGQATITSLPGSPYDGQEVYYLADATNGVVWHLKYRAGSGSTYKWEYVGGPPLRANGPADSPVSTVLETSSTSYTTTPTGGTMPAVTIPALAGDYDVTIGAVLTNAGGNGFDALMSYSVGATAASDADALGTQGSSWAYGSRTRRKTGVAASSSIASRLKAPSGGSGPCRAYGTQIEVVPVRVA